MQKSNSNTDPVTVENIEQTQFGERHVSPEEKTSLVRGVFDSVADRYDVMNDFMSAGIHRLWKGRLVRMVRPKLEDTILDVAGGTGDIAFRMRKAVGVGADITICDLNTEMLRVGRDRAFNRGWVTDFSWATGNAEALPFPDNSFDVYTIAFGLRNVTHIDTALQEAARVLKPGGRFFCLEFSHVDNPYLATLYDTYSRIVIPHIGKTVTGDKESYQYLIESIRKFPSSDQLSSRIKQAGFSYAHATALTRGVVRIHKGIL